MIMHRRGEEKSRSSIECKGRQKNKNEKKTRTQRKESKKVYEYTGRGCGGKKERGGGLIKKKKNKDTEEGTGG